MSDTNFDFVNQKNIQLKFDDDSEKWLHESLSDDG
jgi:hypothetical protein